jgi:hypothetical protein
MPNFVCPSTQVPPPPILSLHTHPGGQLPFVVQLPLQVELKIAASRRAPAWLGTR